MSGGEEFLVGESTEQFTRRASAALLASLGEDWNAEHNKACAAELERRKQFTTKKFGPRCPDFEPGCFCCDQWKMIDDFERSLNNP